MNNLTKITANGIDFKVGNPIQVTWDSSSNMNNFKEPGVYEIYGEITKHDDNLPINNANTGHSFFARLTVIASTLQPANNEICITQMLLLSNRLGGDGNMYIRTYNENNSPFDNGWGLWKKFQGVEEGYIFTDTRKLNQDFGLQTYEVGLNHMVDNGTYSGVYVNEEAIIQNGDLDSNGNGTGSLNTDISQVKFIETFNLVVINDYAVAGQVNNMLDSLGMGEYKKERQICQIKTSTDYFSGTSSIKKRVCKGNGDEYKNSSNWSDWEDIGGGGSSEVELDINTISTANSQGYKINTLISQGLIKENVTYVLNFQNGYWHSLKTFFSSKPINTYFEKGKSGITESELKIIYRNHNDDPVLWIEGYNAVGDYYIMSIKNPHEDTEVIKVSSPMTVLE